MTNTNLLDKVVAEILVPWATYEGTEAKWNRWDALWNMKSWIDMVGAYDFAKDWGVLVDNSAEEFMIQFMTAFNDEVRNVY